MFFKKALLLNKVILILSMTLFFNSCSLPLNEKSPPQTPPQTKLDFETKCLSDVLPIMEKFIAGEAQPHEINKSWKCFSDGLDIFYKKVKGQNQEEYSTEELTQFFEDYFFPPELKLNSTLRREIMKIKQLLVGGSPKTLTRAEIKALQSFGEIARSASLQVLPYMKIMSSNWKASEKKSIQLQLNEFTEASVKFSDFTRTIALQVKKNNIDYELSSLIVLLEEISALYKESWPIIQKIKKYLPVTEQLKSILIGGLPHVISSNEWPNFTNVLSRSYVQYLRYYYFIKHQPIEFENYDLLIFTNVFDDLFDCLGEVVKNKPQGFLSKAEILNGLKSLKVIFPETTITPRFIDQILLLKRLFLGGTADLILSSEFNKGREKLKLIEKIGQSLYSYRSVYFLKWSPGYPLNERQSYYLDKANQELLNINKELTLLFENSYDLNNLSHLINEIQILLRSAKVTSSSLNQIKKILPLLIPFKELATASPGSLVKPKEWSQLLTFLSESYGDYLVYFYKFSPAPSWRHSTLPYSEMLNRLFTRSLKVIKNHNGHLNLKYFKPLFLAFQEVGFIKTNIKFESVNKFLLLLKNKLLWLPAFPKRAPPEHFQEIHIEQLKLAWNDFNTLQVWINENFRPQDYVNRQQFSSRMNLLSPAYSRLLEYIYLTPTTNLLSNLDGYLIFSHTSKQSFERSSLQNQNLIRILIQILLKTYSSNPELSLTLNEFNTLFNDFKPLLIDLELLDPSKNSFANSRFLEANLFMPSSNGNSALELPEALELTQFLLSGIKRHTLIYNEIQKICPKTVQTNQKIEYSVNCWLNQSQQLLNKSYLHMTDARKVYSQLDGPAFNQTWMNFLWGVGWLGTHPQWVSSDDFSLVPHLVQYNESLFNRFDFNSDQILLRNEAMSAYPIFRETLRSAVSNRSERMLRGGFAYILVHKRLPETTLEKLSFATSWIYDEENWPIRLNRMEMAQVHRFISQFLENAATQAIDLSGGLIPQEAEGEILQ